MHMDNFIIVENRILSYTLSPITAPLHTAGSEHHHFQVKLVKTESRHQLTHHND